MFCSALGLEIGCMLLHPDVGGAGISGISRDCPQRPFLLPQDQTHSQGRSVALEAVGLATH